MEDIQSGIPKQRKTIAEIAEHAGVSIPTVSRVLNNRPDVSPKTRARVERVIQEHGFVRSSVANSLRKGSSGIIDLMLPDLGSPYEIEILRGAEEAVERTEFRLALSATYADLQKERLGLAKVINSATDGMILVLAQGQSECLDTLRSYHIPFVVVDHLGELGPDVPAVGVTNWSGGRTATDYLLASGHTRIAVIGGPPSLRCGQDRIAGYRAALEARGIPIDPQLIRPGAFLQQTGYEQTCALLELENPPTAIFAGSDRQATGVYSALRARGLAIPDAISVIGFDDVPLASIVTPTLTTVRQPLMEMGRVAMTMLLCLIAKERLDSLRIELATSLVVRESCAPLPLRTYYEPSQHFK